jgi:Spy/CpxP family protein refolding chaperone
VLLGLVGVTTTPAWPQSIGLSRALMLNKGVQQELKLTDEQAQRITVISKDMQRRQREEMTKLSGLPPGPDRRQKIQDLIRTVNDDFRKNIDDVLTPEQVKRLDQILLQRAGVNTFTTPRIVKALKLTDDQKVKIREIEEELGKSLRETVPDDQKRLGDASEMVAELRKLANEKALDVLTDAQRKAWLELTGKPFVVKLQSGDR